MRYFICAIDTKNCASCLGIPAQLTERIIPVKGKQIAIHETGEQEIFISLPRLLKQEDPDHTEAKFHGIVLKNMDVKTVLLVPQIDMDMEIPEESIHPLPELLSASLRYFAGAFFSGKNMVLILDPKKLLEYIQ